MIAVGQRRHGHQRTQAVLAGALAAVLLAAGVVFARAAGDQAAAFAAEAPSGAAIAGGERATGSRPAPGRSAAAPSDVGRWTPGAALRLPFPRLGMWWPDTSRQSAARIARYDWVILGEWDRSVVPKLRSCNPDLIALTSTNACELGFDPSPDAGPGDNAEVRAVPGEWFLTQVGSTLTSGVDAMSTVLPVAAVTLPAAPVADGEQVDERLFVAGDDVLIGDEVVKVLSVDSATRTLRVRRGYVRPAAPHAAGARVAALVSFWPRSWLLDLSTFCPAVVVDAAAGPETWAEYNARIAAGLVADPVWDGLLIDRSDGDESWLIGNSTARSIDADRSNRRVADGYAAFDAAWNAGLRRYESRTRELAGDRRLIFVNWGHPNYDLLNGNNFEGFPDDRGTAYGAPWRPMVFGPEPRGSYFEWLDRARQPNLSMIETYEDDGGADPTGDGEYQNPAARPGFRPDFRKMRFGLCTALLGDGFFSYEINTNGHGSLGLLWFDEYDNAGKGRGYLGQPRGPARRAVGLPSSRPLNRGGGFESPAGLGLWDLWADEEAGCAASAVLDRSAPASGRASARIDVSRAAGVGWQVSLGTPTAVRARRDHTLSFRARADRARTIDAWVQQDEDPWRTRVDFGGVRLSTRWRRYVLCAPATATDAGAQLLFGLGQTEGAVWLDDVRLQMGNTQIWRRDFARGVALVNAGATPRTVALRGTYRHLRGRQVPSVNTGRLARRVTLRPRDGVILLRAPQARP
jgi:hypothetical protein